MCYRRREIYREHIPRFDLVGWPPLMKARYGLMKETVFFSLLSNGSSHSDDECDSAMDETFSTDLKSSQNDEVKVFLQCTSPLLWSQNCAVVLAAAGIHWIVASEDVKKIVKPILFLLGSSSDSRSVSLQSTRCAQRMQKLRSEAAQEVEILRDANVNHVSFESDEPESLSRSSEEESDYNSENSIVDSAESEVSGYARDDNENNHGAFSLISQEGIGVSNQLIHLSDDGNGYNKSVGSARQNSSNLLPMDLVDMLSKLALETWLDQQPGNPESSSSTQGSRQLSSARVSVKDIGGTVKPKVRSLLDPVNQNGLRVDYFYSSEISSISPLLVCIEVSFMNQSDEHLTIIAVVDEEFNGDLCFSRQEQELNESSKSADVPTMFPMEEIASLDPGRTEKKLLQIRFYHHLSSWLYVAMGRNFLSSCGLILDIL
ncbi:AP3-complex subunit beta-A [Acorus gramineus]|uniref:AP3-complex subunit beta-A n=1 Tax=Acorus gramineus TaxID=55184 RepID=A0AAV9AMH2_ACOGR|nr:AP3-complex subunit beta-A [Acorus gramineus]